MSVSTMQIFIEINFEGDKIAFKTESYTRDHFIFNQLNSPKASLINFIWNDHSCKILYLKQVLKHFHCFSEMSM